MGAKQKLKGLFSLSAAAIALLQNSPSASANIPPVTIDRKQSLKELPASSTDKLVLSPPTAGDLQEFAGHGSHSSHSSHASHSSHYSGYSAPARSYAVPVNTYQAPAYYQAPVQPVVSSPPPTPKPAPPTVQKRIAPATPVTKTNSPSTNALVDGGQLTTNATAKPNLNELEAIKRLAAQGYPFAQRELGMRYLNGNGVEQSLEKAKSLLEMAARQGDDDAQAKLKELGK